MLAVPDQRMEVSVSIAEVLALLIRTGIAFGVDPLGGSPVANALAPGTHRHESPGPTPDELVQKRRQAGQSSGVRGLRRRWSVVRTLAAGPDWTRP
jgi:hypothetical protein